MAPAPAPLYRCIAVSLYLVLVVAVYDVGLFPVVYRLTIKIPRIFIDLI